MGDKSFEREREKSRCEREPLPREEPIECDIFRRMSSAIVVTTSSGLIDPSFRRCDATLTDPEENYEGER